MIYYKNNTNHVKKFYGIDFEPHSIHGVSGYINDANMIRVNKPEELENSLSKKSIRKSSPSQVDQKNNDSNNETIKEEIPDGSNIS